MEKCFIYVLKDPKSLTIRYVGKTNNLKKRYAYHLHSSRLNGKTKLKRWLKTLLSESLKPIMEEIEEIDVSNWELREKYWIAFYKEKGCDLCNHTEGGYGISSCSEETKNKLRENNKRNIEKYRTPEFRAKISLLSKNMVRTEEHSRKISESKKGVKRSKETIDKISAARKGKRYISDEKYKEIYQKNANRLKKHNENKQKQVFQLDQNNQIIKEWDSISEVFTFFGVPRSTFKSYLNANKLFKGFYFVTQL